MLTSRPSCETSINNCSNETLNRTDANVHFRCADFHTLLTFADRAAAFDFDPSFSYGKCRQALLDDQVSVNPVRYASSRKISFKRGIAIVQNSSSATATKSELTKVYELITKLRSAGCALPIELWLSNSYKSDMPNSQALIQRMAKTQGIYLRQTETKRTTGTSTWNVQVAKAYAAFYSAFDNVLVLDFDGLATAVDHRNLADLFTAKAFVDSGAIFWQDEPSTEAKKPAGFVVRMLFGLESSNGAALFHQDTGRMLIDRRRNRRALNTLLFYIECREELDALQLDAGNDLYQIAWAATYNSFHVMPAP